MNVGILGYGAIAREHALALRRIGQTPDGRGVSLVGVMGRLLEPARDFAQEFGAALATTDLDELLANPRVEAVIVCSPTDLHAEQTERALRAGELKFMRQYRLGSWRQRADLAEVEQIHEF